MDLFPNETVVFQWLLFMTALFALHFGVFRPVLHLLRERRERTVGEREKGEELVRRSQDLLAQCETRIAQGRVIGMKLREEQLREGEKIQRETLNQTRTKIDQMMEELRKDLDQKSRETQLKLRQYAEELSQEITEEILERKVG